MGGAVLDGFHAVAHAMVLLDGTRHIVVPRRLRALLRYARGDTRTAMYRFVSMVRCLARGVEGPRDEAGSRRGRDEAADGASWGPVGGHHRDRPPGHSFWSGVERLRVRPRLQRSMPPDEPEALSKRERNRPARALGNTGAEIAGQRRSPDNRPYPTRATRWPRRAPLASASRGESLGEALCLE